MNKETANKELDKIERIINGLIKDELVISLEEFQQGDAAKGLTSKLREEINN